MATVVAVPPVMSIVAAATLVALRVFRVPPVIVSVAATCVATVAIVVTVVTVVVAMIVMVVPVGRPVNDRNGNGEWEEEGQWEGRPDGHCSASAVIVVRACGGGRSQSDHQSDQQSCSEDRQCEAHGAARFRIMNISFVQHGESFLLESPPVPDAGSVVSGR